MHKKWHGVHPKKYIPDPYPLSLKGYGIICEGLPHIQCKAMQSNVVNDSDYSYPFIYMEEGSTVAHAPSFSTTDRKLAKSPMFR